MTMDDVGRLLAGQEAGISQGRFLSSDQHDYQLQILGTLSKGERPTLSGDATKTSMGLAHACYSNMRLSGHVQFFETVDQTRIVNL